MRRPTLIKRLLVVLVFDLAVPATPARAGITICPTGATCASPGSLTPHLPPRCLAWRRICSSISLLIAKKPRGLSSFGWSSSFQVNTKFRAELAQWTGPYSRGVRNEPVECAARVSLHNASHAQVTSFFCSTPFSCPPQTNGDAGVRCWAMALTIANFEVEHVPGSPVLCQSLGIVNAT